MSILRNAISGGGTLIYKIATYTTTATTVEVSTDGLRRVIVLGITPLATSLATDVLGVNETSGTDGVIDVPAAGTLSITRPAAGTSGLKIGVSMLGY